MLLEEHLGAMVHSANAAGAAALVAYLWHHGGVPDVLTDALGSYHYDSFAFASEAAYVAAHMIDTAAEPMVPDCRERLREFGGARITTASARQPRSIGSVCRSGLRLTARPSFNSPGGARGAGIRRAREGRRCRRNLHCAPAAAAGPELR